MVLTPLKPKNPAALVEMLISVTGSFSFFEAAVLACVFLRFLRVKLEEILSSIKVFELI